MTAKPPGKNAIRFIAITMAIDMAGVGLILPVMPDLIRDLAPMSVGNAAGIAGWLVFAFAAMQFFCAPIAGNLGDRFGRRPVLLIALAGLSIDYLIMAVAPTLWMLFIGRMLAGLAGSTWAVANAYIADVSDPESRAKNFGIVSAAGAVGLVLGPAVGGVLGSIDPRTPFYAAAAMAAANCLYGWFVLPETVKAENKRDFEWQRANPIGGILQVRSYPMVLGILGALFVLHIANQSIAHIAPFFAKELLDWSTLEIGLATTFYGVCLAGIQGGLTGPTVKKFGEIKAVFLGLAAGAATYSLLSIASTGWMIYAFIFLNAFGGFATPSMQSLMTRAAPANAQGALQGAIASTLAVTVVIGPLLMTQLFSFFTRPDHFYFVGAPFLASAFFALGSMAIFALVVRRGVKAPTQQTASDTIASNPDIAGAVMDGDASGANTPSKHSDSMEQNAPLKRTGND